MTAPSTQRRTFQAPKGTRDLYPEEMLRRRYITETWRAVSVRHGFEEIDGPTFEHADLYTVKSGEEILSQLFSFTRAGGDDLYALRPEFTPTLARMYAARARQLPKPVRWFCIPSFFRAERPQRGRLREFLQWNADVLGDETQSADAAVIDVGLGALDAFGFSRENMTIQVNDRRVMEQTFAAKGLAPDQYAAAFSMLDRLQKLPPDAIAAEAERLGVRSPEFLELLGRIGESRTPLAPEQLHFRARRGDEFVEVDIRELGRALDHAGWTGWWGFDTRIARGLAYYTGTVFEVIAEGERAVAGGGRYDGLVELVGGDPTPAVGFAMGDVVLGLLLEESGRMPEGAELADAIQRTVAATSLRPEVFVSSNGTDDAEAQVAPLLATLRRGEEVAGFDGQPWSAERYAIRPLHARTTGKATRNVGKLLKEASAMHARVAVVIESGEHATVKWLETGKQDENVPLEEIAQRVA